MAKLQRSSFQLNLSDGRVLLQEGLLFRFFMKRTHDELSSFIPSTLKLYLDHAGQEILHWYVDNSANVDPELYKGWSPPLQPLNSEAWTRVHDEIRSPDFGSIELYEHRNQAGDFGFEYQGRTPMDIQELGVVSQLSFWLPLDWLETHGPVPVQELARAVARKLPLDSGYVSPAFNTVVNTTAAMRFIAEHCLSHPGLDIPQIGGSTPLATRVRGAYWLNVYGPSVIEPLGGREHLRERLAHPGISVEDLGADKLFVSLGSQPERSADGSGFQAYRHLARVLEPLLHEPRLDRFDPSLERWRAWHRRFLD